MSDPVYLLHLVMGAIIGGIGIACHLSLRQGQSEATQRVLEGLDQAVKAVNEDAEFYAQQHAEFINDLGEQLTESINRSRAVCEGRRTVSRITVDGHNESRGGML